MTRITQTIGQSPFHPVTSFTALACGLERITPKAPTMDLQLAIDKSRKLNEALLCAKGAQMTGGDSAPIIADAVARLAEVANALGHFADPIDAATAPTDEHDEALPTVGAEYRFIGETGSFYTHGKLYRIRRIDPDGMFVMDDDDAFGGLARHYWNPATFRGRFELVSGEAAMAAVEARQEFHHAAE